MKKTLIIIFLVVILLVQFKSEEESKIVIPSDSIRFRVISNSIDELDIKRKNDLKEYIENIVFDLVKGKTTKDEVDEVIVNNLDLINEKVYHFLDSKDYKIDYGQNFFPEKIYKGVIYEAGMYDSLVITLGNGKGSNWWCVLFPPLCLLEENTTTSDVEYQFFISRIIDNFK